MQALVEGILNCISEKVNDFEETGIIDWKQCDIIYISYNVCQ